MEPVMEANTSCLCPARMAARVMISSAALPKVALRSPPTSGPVFSATTYVASPRIFASGMIARAEAAKTRISSMPAKCAGRTTGKNKSRNNTSIFNSLLFVSDINADTFYVVKDLDSLKRSCEL